MYLQHATGQEHLATTATLFKHQLSKKLSTVLMDYLCCSLLHTELEGPPLCSSYHTHEHTHSQRHTHTHIHIHTETHTLCTHTLYGTCLYAAVLNRYRTFGRRQYPTRHPDL